MRRRPPRSTQSRSSAASDVYKRQAHGNQVPRLIPPRLPARLPAVLGAHSLQGRVVHQQFLLLAGCFKEDSDYAPALHAQYQSLAELSMDNLVTNRVASCFLRPLGMTGMTARSNPAPPTGGASPAPPRSTARRGIAHLRERARSPLFHQ